MLAGSGCGFVVGGFAAGVSATGGLVTGVVRPHIALCAIFIASVGQ
ncbi:MAG: hypothetical protein FWG53_05305 [Clostridiales bacterium]|nr:hypothetical protein [Clostridiales bacterium]